MTTPSLDTIDYIDSLGLNKADFSLERKKVMPLLDGGQQKKSRKLICPGCGCSVRATKVVHLACLDCKLPMFEV